MPPTFALYLLSLDVARGRRVADWKALGWLS